MKLIDADALGELVSHGVVHYEDIMAQPTVDAVPIIRCKDCKYWDGDDDDTFCSELGIFGTDPKSYCSYAKRKEE